MGEGEGLRLLAAAPCLEGDSGPTATVGCILRGDAEAGPPPPARRPPSAADFPAPPMAAQVMGLSGGVWRRTGACPDDGCSGTCVGFTVRTAAGITRTVASSSAGRLIEVGITTVPAGDGPTATTAAGDAAEGGGTSAFAPGNASEKGGGVSCLSSSSTASSCQIRALTRPDPDSANVPPWAAGCS